MSFKIKNTDLINIFESVKPMLNNELKKQKFNINMKFIGNNSPFDSLDYITFTMELEKFFNEKKIILNLSNNFDLDPKKNLSIKEYLTINKIQVVNR